MSYRSQFVGILGAFALIVSLVGISAAIQKEPEPAKKKEVKPEVMALLKKSIAVYQKMKSYRHTATWSIEAPTEEGTLKESLKFVLAVDRPNRFVYKTETKSELFLPTAAYCDGNYFINFRSKVNQFVKKKAPATYKGINIIDDVEFQPIATYIVALMLQGDPLGDKDIRRGFEGAVLKPLVTEKGKKWHVIEMPLTEDEPVYLLYISEDGRVGKVIQRGIQKISETIEDVVVDKPLDDKVFQYKLPEDAKEVQRFSTNADFKDA